RGEHVKGASVGEARRRLVGRLKADAGPRAARMRNLVDVDRWAQAQLARLDRQVAGDIHDTGVRGGRGQGSATESRPSTTAELSVRSEPAPVIPSGARPGKHRSGDRSG